MKLTFGDLLGLEIGANCTVLAVPATSAAQGALLVLGVSADHLVKRLSSAFNLAPLSGPLRVLFGYALMNAPFPLLVGALMTERNTLFDKLSLFAWVEDNAILEPRAEIFGLTPFGEQPVLYLRDLDLDRPIEAWIATEQPTRWLRVAGILIVDDAHQGDAKSYLPDEGAIAALRAILPPDTQALVSGLGHEVTAGLPLRVALRRRRKYTDAQLMLICDGWRVLAQSARFVRLGSSTRDQRATEDPATDIANILQVDVPRKW